ncbi:cobalt-precorrin-6A reductase [Tropicimonas sp. IMCC6043]|uniref:cobalt-precorrin-6A reductase n=1 Tax=Tropicimonas sp. IMCC6043 TaxID=2510645 RepID=UPI00101CB5FE|nr:cobalt-precorrin-6A reductase [Tropicimonas sp. IMCC6043]RYH11647.1 cobalt-precorrin-6A reductase [Tropicimonas sp. IMCC6043]
MSRPHVLLLAGTSEARQLAGMLAGWPLDLTVSLAGATQAPAPVPGRLRTGGFGGAAGLADWLEAQSVDLLVDATHPFAEAISANAAAAAAQVGCPLLRFERSPWRPAPGERWQTHASLEAALLALPAGARALLTTGSRRLAALAERPDVTLILRAIEMPADLPPRVEPILARPPFTEAGERALMTQHRITHLVTRNSGGAGRAKLTAAAALGVEVLMIARPVSPPEGETLDNVAALSARIAERLALDTASGGAP